MVRPKNTGAGEHDDQIGGVVREQADHHRCHGNLGGNVSPNQSAHDQQRAGNAVTWQHLIGENFRDTKRNEGPQWQRAPGACYLARTGTLCVVDGAARQFGRRRCFSEGQSEPRRRLIKVNAADSEASKMKAWLCSPCSMVSCGDQRGQVHDPTCRPAGRRGIRHAVPGSVAERFLLVADCPVLMISASRATDADA